MIDGFPTSSLDIKHFTDLRRYSLMEHHPTAKKQEKVVDLPCATKLHESGVRFRCAKEGCMLDLKFDTNKRGILPFFKVYELQIPCFTVNDWTEFFIRNVMALEQCHYPKETHICNYIAFMDFLINTEKDADLLIDKGIIINCLGENTAIANMFNRFCLQTSSSVSCYYDMARDLKQHYESPYNNAKATFKSVYFSNPWKGTATVAVTLLLILTIVQTVYSILQFHVQ
ncbi:hypothetical protein EZV62_008063 [Acer yangbiense]|uniref:Uncharacterized protein n=1 Tax=Acer yangbiense TaxID=1000413 RepID=A0A5C7ICH8_9ROSI|nr:hypothetical protein EZV62_008063 [Acer yangbiense]